MWPSTFFCNSIILQKQNQKPNQNTTFHLLFSKLISFLRHFCKKLLQKLFINDFLCFASTSSKFVSVITKKEVLRLIYVQQPKCEKGDTKNVELVKLCVTLSKLFNLSELQFFSLPSPAVLQEFLFYLLSADVYDLGAAIQHCTYLIFAYQKIENS